MIKAIALLGEYTPKFPPHTSTNAAIKHVSGSDAEGEIRVIEHPEHPFFIGTLFVPQSRPTSLKSHPLVTAFLEAVVRM